jgi:hypothetical protein
MPKPQAAFPTFQNSPVCSGLLTLAISVKRKEPPGAIVRYDGRLTTPSACVPYCKTFVAFLGMHGLNAPFVRYSGQPCEPSVV